MSKSALDSLKSVFNVFKRKPSLRALERTRVYLERERVERGYRFLGFKLPPPTPTIYFFEGRRRGGGEGRIRKHYQARCMTQNICECEKSKGALRGCEIK